MDNTELRQIPVQAESEYYADLEGFIWRKLKGRPRHNNEKKIVTLQNLGEDWFSLVKPSPCGKQRNYLRFDLSKKQIAVHRAVLLAFNNVEGSEYLQANHKNRNTFDNRLENLEWVTNVENAQHKLRTTLPKPYSELEKDWWKKFSDRQAVTDTYQVKSGWQLKYDVDRIIHLLKTTDKSMESIAEQANCSFRAVRYWQEKLKIDRPKMTLMDKVSELLSKEDLSAQQLAKRIGVRVTSIHAVLRKRKA